MCNAKVFATQAGHLARQIKTTHYIDSYDTDMDKTIITFKKINKTEKKKESKHWTKPHWCLVTAKPMNAVFNVFILYAGKVFRSACLQNSNNKEKTPTTWNINNKCLWKLKSMSFFVLWHIEDECLNDLACVSVKMLWFSSWSAWIHPITSISCPILSTDTQLCATVLVQDIGNHTHMFTHTLPFTCEQF